MKEDIRQNIAKFVCTACFESDPLLGKRLEVDENHGAISNDILDSDTDDSECTLLETVTVVEDTRGNDNGTVKRAISHVKISFKCDACEKVVDEEEELRNHIVNTHGEPSSNKDFVVTIHKCSQCSFQTDDGNALNLHWIREHDVASDDCQSTFKYVIELKEHTETQHSTLSCEFCRVIVNDEETLRNHMSTVHSEKRQKCSECDFEANEETTLKEHWNSKHTSGRDLVQENIKLKKEIRNLNSSYDRLNTMYTKMKAEMEDKALGFKIQISEAQDQFKSLKSENEKLKETNEVQQNLWKIWLENFKNNKSLEKVDDAHETVEVNEGNSDSGERTEDNDEDIDIDGWFQQNRHRGFKRVPKDSVNNPIQAGAKVANDGVKENTAKGENTPRRPRRYCHNWNNNGRCDFKGCKFLHSTAPVCNFDGRCNRKKCMYRHVQQKVWGETQQSEVNSRQLTLGDFLRVPASLPQLTPWFMGSQLMNPWLMDPTKNMRPRGNMGSPNQIRS